MRRLTWSAQNSELERAKETRGNPPLSRVANVRSALPYNLNASYHRSLFAGRLLRGHSQHSS